METHGAKVIDCTIRDGGLVNNWDFSIDFVSSVYRALDRAGVDYMEIGYKNSPKLLERTGAGPWAFLDESVIRQAIPAKGRTQLSALVDIGRVDETEILPRAESMIDLIRVACYAKDVEKAVDLASKFHRMGYETSVNIMALSHVKSSDLHECLARLADSAVQIVYIVDSFGSLFPWDIEQFVDTFTGLLPGKQLGIHTHNNLQMAFANTLSALRRGVHFLDASLFGMGRAAGNCPTELLLSQLTDPRYDVRPVLDVLEKLFVPLRAREEWGYTIPYALVGMLNEHPRTAIALRASEERDRYLAFYDRLTSVETHGGHL